MKNINNDNNNKNNEDNDMNLHNDDLVYSYNVDRDSDNDNDIDIDSDILYTNSDENDNYNYESFNENDYIKNGDEYIFKASYLNDDLSDDLDDLDSELKAEILQIRKEAERKKKEKQKPKKPKLIGKHSLAHDSFFKGKKVELDELESESYIKNVSNDGFEMDDHEVGESRDSIDSYQSKKLKTEIYKILSTFTDIEMYDKVKAISESDFNAYYALLIKDLAEYGFSRCAIFVELASYFYNNIFNAFKILNAEYAKVILQLIQLNTINKKV